jgi:hypothetical protein
MRSTVRQISVILLLAALLVPGLLQARTPARHSARTAQSTQMTKEPSVFSSVWNLLTSGWLKTGPTLDPSGAPSGSGTGTGGSSSTSTTGDTGPTLDPSGQQ